MVRGSSVVALQWGSAVTSAYRIDSIGVDEIQAFVAACGRRRNELNVEEVFNRVVNIVFIYVSGNNNIRIPFLSFDFRKKVMNYFFVCIKAALCYSWRDIHAYCVYGVVNSVYSPSGSYDLASFSPEAERL